MAGAPVAQFGHHRDEVVAGFAEVVGHLLRHGCLDATLDDAVFFQLTQLRGKDFFAHAGEQVTEFGKAPRHEAEMPDQQNFPLTA